MNRALYVGAGICTGVAAYVVYTIYSNRQKCKHVRVTENRWGVPTRADPENIEFILQSLSEHGITKASLLKVSDVWWICAPESVMNALYANRVCDDLILYDKRYKFATVETCSDHCGFTERYYGECADGTDFDGTEIKLGNVGENWK